MPLPASLKRVAVAALKKQTKSSNYQLSLAELQRNKKYFNLDASVQRSNAQLTYSASELVEQTSCKQVGLQMYIKTRLQIQSLFTIGQCEGNKEKKDLGTFSDTSYRGQYDKGKEKTLLCSASPWTLALSAVLSFAVFCEGTKENGQQMENLANEEKQRKFRTVIDDLQSDNIESAQGALKYLLVLVQNSDNHEILIKLGIATALVNVLSCSNQEARLLRQVGVEETSSGRICLDRSQIVYILAQLSQSTCSHNALMEANVVASICDLLQDMGWKTSNHSPGTFSWLPEWLSFGRNRNERNKEKNDSSLPKVASTVALSSQESMSSSLLLDLRREDQQKSQMTHSCIQLISHLACNPKFIDKLMQSPVIYPLLDIFQHDEDLITRREALLAVASLAKADSNVFVKSGALSLLTQYSESQDPQLSSYAVGALLNAMKHGDIDTHRQFMKEEGHRKLISICQRKDKAYEQSRIFAVLTLGELFQTEHPKGTIIRQKLLQSGAVDVWKDILLHSHEEDEALLRNVCKVFWLCGQKSASRDIIAKALDDKTVEKLVSFLGKTFSNELSCASLFALSFYVNDEKVKHELAKQEHLIENIVPMLSRSSNVSEVAVSILSSLSTDTASHMQLCKASCLIALLKVPSTPSNSQFIVQLLANLSKNEACRVHVAHEGGLSLLLKFANSKDQTLRQEAARALYNLCRPGVTRTMVVQAGALRTLVSLIASTDDPVTSKYAIGCLSSIAESFENVPRLAELGVASLLVKKLGNTPKPSKEMLRYSVLCIAEMANIMEIHSLLADSGVIPVLLSCCASRDLETQQYALMALCNLSATESVRPLLKQQGATRILGIVLRSAMPLPEIQGMAAAILANLTKGEQNMIHIQPLSPLTAA
ncbi:hypothetical protein Gasu2_08560 [Galdieria sulphuraria]|nr:hypothetical protein Gasu2_08560 [Galdieria sulphuraria]